MPKNFQISQLRTSRRLQRLPRRRGRRQDVAHRDRAARTWRRTPASRPTSAAPPAASTARTTRWFDYNRAGIPLIEIVTKPDRGRGADAPKVAKAYVAELRELIKALGVLRGPHGTRAMRCDANLSLRPFFLRREKFGTRSETKNVNSCDRSSARSATRSSATPRS